MLGVEHHEFPMPYYEHHCTHILVLSTYFFLSIDNKVLLLHRYVVLTLLIQKNPYIILRLLGQYFAGRFTIGQLCERYEISQNQFYKLLALFKSRKQEWLGILSGQETSDFSFLKRIKHFARET